MAAFATIFTIMTILLGINITSGSRSRHQKNIGLVQSISSSQAVEEGSSVEFECRLGKIPDRAEVAWVKLKGLGDVEYLSTYRKDEGAMDYEEEFTSDMEKDGDEAVWSLTLFRVTKSMAGFYQCEVKKLYTMNCAFPSSNRCMWCQRRQVLAGISRARLSSRKSSTSITTTILHGLRADLNLLI